MADLGAGVKIPSYLELSELIDLVFEFFDFLA